MIQRAVRIVWGTAFSLILAGNFCSAGAKKSEPDWDKSQTELIGFLQALIRCNTVNPPGNELEACRLLKDFFDNEGIEATIYDAGEGRGNLIARLRGGGDLLPIFFVAHTDVVPFEEEEWSVPPLSGEIRDGYLYGRGAFDDKGMLAIEALALALLKRQGIPLQRDIVMLATADEEAGGVFGVGWLLENLGKEMKASFALNEGGRIVLKDDQPLYVGIQTCEKAAYNIRLIAHGVSGHASVPRQDNVIYALARALTKLQELSSEQRLNSVTRAFFLGMARIDPRVQWQNDQVQTDDPLYLAMLGNTISPTIIAGGAKSNVLPSSAEVNLNCRLLPDQDINAFADTLRRVMGSSGYELAYTPRAAPPDPSSRDGAGFMLIEQVCRKMFSRAPILPYLSPGMSDATRLRRAGIPTYGLLPFPLSEDDAGRIHGKDERVSLEALAIGLKLAYRLAELAAR